MLKKSERYAQIFEQLAWIWERNKSRSIWEKIKAKIIDLLQAEWCWKNANTPSQRKESLEVMKEMTRKEEDDENNDSLLH